VASKAASKVPTRSANGTSLRNKGRFVTARRFLPGAGRG
jgi:hypothetical protein